MENATRFNFTCSDQVTCNDQAERQRLFEVLGSQVR